MTVLTTRAIKGSALSYTEADSNFKIGAQAKTSSYAFVNGDNRDTVEFDGTDLSGTLPAASTITNSSDTGDYQVTAKNLNATPLTILRSSTDTVDGATSFILNQYESATFKVNQAKNAYNVIGYRISQDAVAITGGTITGVVGIPVTKIKSADETVSASSTLQDDDDFTGWNLTAGKYYELKGVIIFSDSANGTFKLKLSFTSTEQSQFLYASYLLGTSYTESTQTSIGGTMTAASLNGVTDTPILVHAIFRANASTGGTMKIQWAQGAANGTSTFGAGSYMKLTRLD